MTDITQQLTNIDTLFKGVKTTYKH